MEVNINQTKFQNILVKRIIIDCKEDVRRILRIAEVLGIKGRVAKELHNNGVLGGYTDFKMTLDYSELRPEIPVVRKWEGDNTHWKIPLDFSVELFPKGVSLYYKTINLDFYTKVLTIEGSSQ